MIPVAAIDAALASLYTETEIGYLPSGIMRAALEAAATHMLADAWDEGERVGFEESFRVDDTRRTRNPYRPTP